MNESSRQDAVQRLSLDTLLPLRTFAEVLGERGFASLWAQDYRRRLGQLPSCRAVALGVQRDLGLTVSRQTAHRALTVLRDRETQEQDTQE